MPILIIWRNNLSENFDGLHFENSSHVIMIYILRSDKKDPNDENRWCV